jgi:hypothetical protein
MGGVGTSILGRPRHLPRDRRASHHPTSDYTLNCEEPANTSTVDRVGKRSQDQSSKAKWPDQWANTSTVDRASVA